mgnify:CR=1 FL=1
MFKSRYDLVEMGIDVSIARDIINPNVGEEYTELLTLENFLMDSYPKPYYVE